MDIFWVKVISGVIIFLLIFGESIQRATRGINPTGWHMPTLPQVSWRLLLASLGGIAVLALFFATESTLAFFEVMLYSKIFWALLIAIIVFRSILTDNWGWFNGTVRWIIAILLAIWIFGGIRSCGSSKPGTGGNSGTTRGIVSDPLSSGSGTLTPGEVQRIWAKPGTTFFRSDTPVKLKYSLASNPLVFWIEDPTDQKPWPSSKRVTGYWEVKNLSETETVLVEWGQR